MREKHCTHERDEMADPCDSHNDGLGDEFLASPYTLRQEGYEAVEGPEGNNRQDAGNNCEENREGQEPAPFRG